MADEKKEIEVWKGIDTPLDYEGKKIILPDDPNKMPIPAAIETLHRIDAANKQKYDVMEVVEGAPWDALTAVYRAMQEIYGVVTSHGGWFSNPVLVTVRTGPGDMDAVQVPVGVMSLPGMTSPIQVEMTIDGAVIKGSVNKADRTRLIEIVAKSRQVIQTKSVYKGKAIRFEVDDKGNMQLGYQPTFLDLTNVRETDMIHPENVQKQIDVSIFSALRNTEACRIHGLSLKRGILMEGKYGTGKTLTSRVVAKVATDNQWTFIMLSRSQGLAAALKFARQYQPCVIFAEDIDRNGDRTTEKVNDLVNLLDGLDTKNSEIMTVLTTNFVDKIDKSLLRPGRFDAIISLQPPDGPTVQKLIRASCGELLASDAVLTKVGEELAGFVPATIEEVIKRAKFGMLQDNRRKISADDLFVAALSMKSHHALLADAPVPKSEFEKFGESLQLLFADVGIELATQQKTKGLGEITPSKVLEGIAIRRAKASPPTATPSA
jgi:transitional endoplasmic reticulum ATPase